jgi:GTP-binding protein Era
MMGRSGFVALVGLPNAGKSTLLNALMARKVSIVTPKAQTTRFPLRAVLTKEETQFVFVDTPGLYKGNRALEETMHRSAQDAWQEADVVLMLVDARKGLQEEDNHLISHLRRARKEAVLVLNKTDVLKEKEVLLPLLQQAQETEAFKEVFPLSALAGTKGKEKMLAQLLETLGTMLPEGSLLYEPETVVDLPIALLAAEITREKAFLHLQEELPYGLAVEPVSLEEDEKGDLHLHQHILLDREPHRQMVIGKGGSMLKKIGTAARKELNIILNRKVHLFLHVKVKKGWPNHRGTLQKIGFMT